MLKFCSEKSLNLLTPGHPAYPVIADLINGLITEANKGLYPYDPDADGFIALVEPGDIDRPLTEIWDEDAYSLIDIPWESVGRKDGMFLAVFLANNQYGIVFVIPDEDWVYGELRECIEAHLDE